MSIVVMIVEAVPWQREHPRVTERLDIPCGAGRTLGPLATGLQRITKTEMGNRTLGIVMPGDAGCRLAVIGLAKRPDERVNQGVDGQGLRRVGEAGGFEMVGQAGNIEPEKLRGIPQLCMQYGVRMR